MQQSVHGQKALVVIGEINFVSIVQWKSLYLVVESGSIDLSRTARTASTWVLISSFGNGGRTGGSPGGAGSGVEEGWKERVELG